MRGPNSRKNKKSQMRDQLPKKIVSRLRTSRDFFAELGFAGLFVLIDYGFGGDRYPSRV